MRGAAVDYEQSHMPYLRELLQLELKNGKPLRKLVPGLWTPDFGASFARLLPGPKEHLENMLTAKMKAETLQYPGLVPEKKGAGKARAGGI